MYEFLNKDNDEIIIVLLKKILDKLDEIETDLSSIEFNTSDL